MSSMDYSHVHPTTPMLERLALPEADAAGNIQMDLGTFAIQVLRKEENAIRADLLAEQGEDAVNVFNLALQVELETRHAAINAIGATKGELDAYHASDAYRARSCAAEIEAAAREGQLLAAFQYQQEELRKLFTPLAADEYIDPLTGQRRKRKKGPADKIASDPVLFVDFGAPRYNGDISLAA